MQLSSVRQIRDLSQVRENKPFLQQANKELTKIYLCQYCVLTHTPGNSHPNGTVKPNANINSKQTTLKATDNYIYTYLLYFISLLYCVFYSISAIMDDKKSLI